MGKFPGTAGYAAEAAALFDRYERRSFDDVHASILDLLPADGRALDIGAGTGRDASALADRGYDVIAVEPTAELREPAKVLHSSAAIKWMDDGLPTLSSLAGHRDAFDLILVTAVWMHLNEDERAAAMAVIAPLLRGGGVMSITLRRGPVPAGRRMFHVEAGEVIEQGSSFGLLCVLDQDEPALGVSNRANGVSWRRVAFTRVAI